MIYLTRAIPERIRGGLRRCAIQVDIYYSVTTALYSASEVTTIWRYTNVYIIIIIITLLDFVRDEVM